MRRLTRRICAFAPSAVGLGLALWAFVFEPASLRVAEYEVVVATGWPSACNGLRIAVLADLHVGSPFKGIDKLDRVVRLTNDAYPDVILLAGDYVIQDVLGGRFVSPEDAAAVLGRLSAPRGVWAVLGNHDWWLGGARVRRAIESAGIAVLEDSARRIAAGPCPFWLMGIGDFMEARHDVRSALAQVHDDAPVLAFTHNPDIFPEIPARVALTIAGHTHGGQVYIPLLGRPIVPSLFGERYAIGHVLDNGRHLFVSPGIGTSIIPVRFLVPPEISVVTVRSTASKQAAPLKPASVLPGRYQGQALRRADSSAVFRSEVEPGRSARTTSRCLRAGTAG